MSGSKNNTMVTSKHNSKPNVASGRSPTPPGLIGTERYAFWNNFLPTLSYTSVAYMLIVVAILLTLAIVYKHVAKPSWIPSSQQLSEKFRLYRLYMAGSMVGDFTRWIFDDWDIRTRSRQDTVIVSNKDEKSRRLSLDMSSSSSTSLSPSVLPTHDASPRYKKTSNFRLTSHRRSSSRQKTQTQNIPASSLSSIEDNPFLTSSNNDSHSEQSSITEQDETKTSVTIHVAETLNSRTDPSSVDTCQESKRNIDNIGNNYNQNSSNTVEHANGKLETDQHLIQDENTDSWIGSQQTPTVISNKYDKNRRLTSDLAFSESSISPTSNGSSKLQKKNSLKGNRKQNARNKEQTVILTTQESDGEIDSIISDDHSDNLIQQINTTVPTTQKHEQDSIQEETFIKTGHKRRRRRTRGSKNNQQKAQQNQQPQNSDQRSLKQTQPISLQKQDISQQNASDVSKLRNHHLNEISKSHQVVEKPKAANYDIWERHPHQQNAESHQSPRSDQTVYFLQPNKRGSYIYHSANLNGTAIPAKATLPESNRKVDIHWKPNEVPSSHVSTSSHNFNPTTSTSNVPISRSTYADVIAPHNRPSAHSRSNTSGLSNGNNITTPVPVASMNNTTNHQWYSPFGSGLSIQLTPPASPQNIHRHLPSTNSNAPNPVLSSKQSQDRNRNVIAPPPSLSASNNVHSFSSSSSMFTSSSFSSSLSDSLSNQNQSNIITLPTNSLFRESLFGRKHPVQDQEKGELSDEVDDSESWNKILGLSELTNQRTWVRQSNDVRKGKFGEGAKNKNINENVWHREQDSQQQFSLFDKRLSFMYPPKP